MADKRTEGSLITVATSQRAPIIYLDCQASTPEDPRVVEAMKSYASKEFANPHSNDHAAGWQAHKALEQATREISEDLGIDTDELIFTSGATEANNLAILGLARRAPQSRRRILVSDIEHECVLAAAQATTRFGFTVDSIPVNVEGLVDPRNLAALLGDDVLLVSIASVNNEIGTIQDLRALSEVITPSGAFLHSDCAQALAAGESDFAALGVDLASLSGHKLYGPKGIGALFVRRGLQKHIEPLMYGGGQQEGLRPGTLPVPLCIGLATAIHLVATEGAAERGRVRDLRNALVTGLRAIHDSITPNGSLEHRHPGNANLQFPGFDSRDLLASVQPFLAASTGSACTSGVIAPSHVLRAIGLSANEAESSIRFGVGRFTTSTDIDEALVLLREALATTPRRDH